jgi:hypothetical protein
MLTSAEVRGKWVLSVEDWAEIRRLYRAERMPIKVMARVVGCSKNTVRKALAAERPPAYRPVFEEHRAEGVGRRAAAGVSTPEDWVGGGCGGAADSGVAAGLPDDAGYGDRGTD